MGRSRETYNKKEVRNKKEKKRKDKLEKRLARKENERKSRPDDMIAYVDENGMISSTPPDPNKKKSVIKAEDIEVSIPTKDPADELDTDREGKVIFYNDSKGYGFIKDNETQEKIFFHLSNLIDEVVEGNSVSFELVKEKRGPVATQVKLVKG